MSLTERLYYNDSHLIEFEARVVDVTERVSGWTAVVLDRTAFYPTGGGQPSDTGTLNGSRVVECIDDGERGVLHVVQGLAPARDAIVSGRVDWLRRLDHMQQHTGQHILSQAFINLFNAPTKSFRVLEATCEIDIELNNPSNETIERAVELANNVVWEDRGIAIHNVSAEDAAAMPLRKEPARDGELRLIEIEGFDLTPCGGTHAYRTGEVGMIAMIDNVRNDSPAETAGLQKNDEIVSLAGRKVSKDTWLKMLARYKKGDSVAVVVKRDRRTIKGDMILGDPERVEYRIEEKGDVTDQQRALRAAWLNGK